MHHRWRTKVRRYNGKVNCKFKGTRKAAGCAGRQANGSLYQRTVLIFWKLLVRNPCLETGRTLQFRERSPPAHWELGKFYKCLAVKRIAQLSEAKRMALKATDIPAASPHVDVVGGAVPSSEANRAANAVVNPAQNSLQIPR